MLSTGTLILALVTFAAERKVLDAAPFLVPALAGCGIQKAIDSLPSGGGIVQLPAGRFVLERYLFLKSGTTLRGKGGKTVLSIGRPETRRRVAGDVKHRRTRTTPSPCRAPRRSGA